MITPRVSFYDQVFAHDNRGAAGFRVYSADVRRYYQFLFQVVRVDCTSVERVPPGSAAVSVW